ncbi:hypothetical protein CCAX7_49580 [Capsulimonas corticalis]|uniref:Uncharacterized protein n=1 Tax=Capsulimonas corticalis TaxID=2219043 RepID=A0A402CPJ1_9BACT|nr:hypothetical protein [Capsulimonas corticalis]BDI32907.1 hypothetical protein CCAX7_49580 [Capsulimonas corticalis]
MSGGGPLFSLIPKPFRHDHERLRAIEHEYQLELVAENARQLVQFYATILRAQASQASQTLRNIDVMVNGRETSGQLGTLATDIDLLVDGMDHFPVDDLQPLEFAQHTILPIHGDPSADLQDTLATEFERLARQLMRQQKALVKIHDRMRGMYEAQAQIRRAESNRWLVSGMKRLGRDREEDFEDALRILKDMVTTPQGMQDYVAWFEIGWLLWKHERNLPEAEEAFYRAQRLSAVKGDAFYVKSLRHLAYVQHLQGRFAEAYETIQKALVASDEHDTRFDAARYAASRGFSEECLRLLEQCIYDRPTTIISMFAEVDFLRGAAAARLARAMADMAARMLEEARDRADDNVEHWQQALEIVREVEREAGLPIALPKGIAEEALGDTPALDDVDYLVALEIERKALAYGDQTVTFARETILRVDSERAIEQNKVSLALHDLDLSQRRIITEAEDDRRDRLTNLNTLSRYIRGGGRWIYAIFFLAAVGVDVHFMPQVQALIGPSRSPVSGPDLNKILLYAYLAFSWPIFFYMVYLVSVLVDSFFNIFRRQQAEAEWASMMDAQADVYEQEAADLRGRLTALETERARTQRALKRLEHV